MKKKLIAAATMAAMAALSAMPMMAATVSYGGAEDGENSVPVTVDYGGTRPGALIPKAIEFSGKTGDYNVIAYAKTADVAKIDTPISITPQSSFTLTKEGTSTTTTANVSQAKKSFAAADLTADGTIQINGVDTAVKQAVEKGTITANGITPGTWKGNLVFTVQ